MSRTTHPEKNGRPQAVRADYYGLNRKHRREDKWVKNDAKWIRTWVDRGRTHTRRRRFAAQELRAILVELNNPGAITPEYKVEVFARLVEDLIGRTSIEAIERDCIAAQTDQVWTIRAHELLIEKSGESLETLIAAGYFTNSELREIEEDMAWDYHNMVALSAQPAQDDWMDPVSDEGTGEFVDWEDLIKLVEDYSSEF